jgi:hypothetical protein
MHTMMSRDEQMTKYEHYCFRYKRMKSAMIIIVKSKEHNILIFYAFFSL